MSYNWTKIVRDNINYGGHGGKLADWTGLIGFLKLFIPFVFENSMNQNTNQNANENELEFSIYLDTDMILTKDPLLLYKHIINVINKYSYSDEKEKWWYAIPQLDLTLNTGLMGINIKEIQNIGLNNYITYVKQGMRDIGGCSKKRCTNGNNGTNPKNRICCLWGDQTVFNGMKKGLGINKFLELSHSWDLTLCDHFEYIESNMTKINGNLDESSIDKNNGLFLGGLHFCCNGNKESPKYSGGQRDTFEKSGIDRLEQFPYIQSVVEYYAKYPWHWVDDGVKSVTQIGNGVVTAQY